MSNISWMSDKLRKKAHDYKAHEVAWDISDVSEIIKEAFRNKKMVLGMELLDRNMKRIRVRWIYDIDLSKSGQYHVRHSCEQAMRYLNHYIRENGREFYVEIVFGRPLTKPSSKEDIGETPER